VVNATTGGTVNMVIDNGAVTVNCANNAVTLASPTGSGQDDTANEYTLSIDFIQTVGSGSCSVSIDPSISEQMGDFGAITVDDGFPVTAILRTRADGTVQIWRSIKVTS
jgi:hypothetical protein